MTNKNLRSQSRELWLIVGNDTKDTNSSLAGFEPCGSDQLPQDTRFEKCLAGEYEVSSAISTN